MIGWPMSGFSDMGTSTYAYDSRTTPMTTAAICATREVLWNPSFYRGEQYDSDLALYYLRARYYNPATGRFMSRDPEDGHAADPKTLHKYLYAGGDPENLFDPTGKAASVDDSLLNTLSLAAVQVVYWGGGVVACGILTGELLDAMEQANKGAHPTLGRAIVVSFEAIACGIFLATWPLVAFAP